MTIGQWNFLLLAGAIVVILAFGYWLKQVLEQQLKAKDSTMAALQTQIEELKAEISRLQGETVPAIAQHYETLKKYAEDAAAERNRLAEELGAVTRTLRSEEQEAPNWALLGEANGLLLAAGFTTKALNDFRDFINHAKPSPEPLAERMSLVLLGSLMGIRTGIETEIKGRRKELKQLLPEPVVKPVVH